MPVTLELRENGYVLLYTIRGRWDVSELIALFPEEKRNRDAAQHTVHAIVDLRAGRNIPTGLTRVRHGPGPTHKTAGYVALIGVPLLTRPLAVAIYRLLQFDRYKFFDSDTEAWAFIREKIATESAGTQN